MTKDEFMLLAEDKVPEGLKFAEQEKARNALVFKLAKDKDAALKFVAYKRAIELAREWCK